MNCSCGNLGTHDIRGINLCDTHYIEALEHGADMTFDARIKVIQLPPIKRKKELSKKYVIGIHTDKCNLDVFKERKK
jgi:hypothetical protein